MAVRYTAQFRDATAPHAYFFPRQSALVNRKMDVPRGSKMIDPTQILNDPIHCCANVLFTVRQSFHLVLRQTATAHYNYASTAATTFSWLLIRNCHHVKLQLLHYWSRNPSEPTETGEFCDLAQSNRYIQGAAKNNPLRFFAVFSAIVWNFKAKLYTCTQ